MTNQLSNQPPKLLFFYRQLPIILGVIIMIIIAGGIFAWQYFGVSEEVKAPEREEIKTPEEVALQFLSWYKGQPLEERTDLTEEYKQKIERIRQQVPPFLADPVIFAQDLPNQVTVGEAEIIDDKAWLIATLRYGMSDHNLKVELLFVKGQWKINDIRLKEEAEAPKDEIIDWKIYRDEKHGFEIKYPKDWQIDNLTGAPWIIRFDIDRNNFVTVEEFKQQHGAYARYDWRFYDDIEIIVYPSPNTLPGNESGLNLDEWIENRMEDHLILKNSKKEITINMYKGVEVEELGKTSYRSIFLLHDSVIYNFFLETSHPKMDILNQMISTFRFLE